MRTRPSLTRTLVVRCSLLALLALTVAVIEHLFRSGIELHYELDALATRIAGTVVDTAEGPRVRLDASLEAWIDDIPDLRLLVREADGPVLLARGVDPADGEDELVVWSLSWPTAHLDIGGGETQAKSRYGYVRTLPAAHGRSVRVAIERSPAERRDRWIWIRTEVTREYGPFVLYATLLTILVVVVTVRRALRPVDRLSRAARAIQPSEPSTLDPGDAPAELLPLVRAANEAFGRLQVALERERRFTADVAHSLRTPLAALRARVEGDPAGGAQRSALLRGVERMQRVVDQLLVKARLQSGTLGEMGTFDLVDLAREAVAELTPLARARQVAFALEAPPEPVWRQGSRAAIEQAIGNILDNARQAAPPGSLVEVEVDRVGRVCVRDRGTGFLDKDPMVLFTPFRRGPTSRWQGAGLGLAIVGEAVQRHGGELFAGNRPGGGAEIGFVLPAEGERKPPASSRQGWDKAAA